MILKSKPIKSLKQLGNVLRYITFSHDISNEGFMVSKLISGDRTFKKKLERATGDVALETAILEARIDNMYAQYVENNKTRKIPHRNANIAYHEIISFHKEDSDKLNQEKLLKVARKYMKERSEYSLMACVLHRDKEHLHLHAVVSSVQLGGSVKRLSRSEFRQLKCSLEAFQETHLKLEHSRIDHSKKKIGH